MLWLYAAVAVHILLVSFWNQVKAFPPNRSVYRLNGCFVYLPQIRSENRALF